MSFEAPVNTLKYHQSRALTTKRDMRLVQLPVVVGKLNQMLQSDKALVVPEKEALWFYGMNHGVSLLRQERDLLEPLTGMETDFVHSYHRRLGFTARKVFSYLLATCTREARHCHTKVGQVTVQASDLPEGYPVSAFSDLMTAVDWLLGAHGGEDGIYGALRNSPPQVPIGVYARALSLVFRRGSWSSAYGGPKWANISDCIVNFVEGTYSAEMMLDTVWTLQHNTASVFNKGIIFEEVSHHLATILDVQRSGQIPEFIISGAQGLAVDPELAKWMGWLLTLFSLGRYVDWFKVKALGGLGNYSSLAALQIKQHGPSKWMDAEAKKVADEAKAAQAKAEQHAKNWFQVMPGVEVKFKTLKRAA